MARSCRGWCRSTSWARLRPSRRPPPTTSRPIRRSPSTSPASSRRSAAFRPIRSWSARTGCAPTTSPPQGGALALNDYARANDPFANVGKVQVAVDVSSVIRASPTSFRVAWIERRYQDGALATTERWSAILTVVVQTPRDRRRARARIRSESTSTPSTGRRSLDNDVRRSAEPPRVSWNVRLSASALDSGFRLALRYPRSPAAPRR